MKPSRINLNRLTDEHLKRVAKSREFDYVSPFIKFECKGKRQYDTKKEIMKDIFRMIDESYGGYSFLRPYKCKFCHKYHLTSND